MEGFEDLDIYNDLDEFQEEQNKKSKELQAVEAKYQDAINENVALRLENKQLQKKIKTIEVNFQNLLDTAKAEIQRKNKVIDELRKEKDDLCFRRNPNKNPFKNNYIAREEDNYVDNARKPQTSPKKNVATTRDRVQYNGRRETEGNIDMQHRIETKVEQDQKSEVEAGKNQYEHTNSRRDNKHSPPRDRHHMRRSRSKDRCSRSTEKRSQSKDKRSRSRNRRSHSRDRRSQSREKRCLTFEQYKSRKRNDIDARNIINAQAKRKQQRDDDFKDNIIESQIPAKRLKTDGNEQFKNEKEIKEKIDKNDTNEIISELLNIAAESDGKTNECAIKTAEDDIQRQMHAKISMSIDSMEETLNKVAYSIENIAEELQKEIIKCAEDTAENEVLPTQTYKKINCEQKEHHSFDDYLELFAETDLSDAETPLSTPMKQEEGNVLLSDLCEPIESEEEIEDFINKQAVEKNQEKCAKEKLKRNLTKMASCEGHDDENMNQVKETKDKERTRSRATHKTENFLRITITSPKKRKENNKKVKDVTKEVVGDRHKDAKKQSKIDDFIENKCEEEKVVETESNKAVEIIENVDLREKLSARKTEAESSHVAKKLMDNIFSAENNHSWLGFKIPKKPTKTKDDVIEDDKQKQDEADQQLEQAGTLQPVTDHVAQEPVQQEKTYDPDVISPKTSALLDEIFENTEIASMDNIFEKHITPKCSPGNDIEMHMRDIFQSPLNASDKPTIISNITIPFNNQISVFDQNEESDLTLEQTPINVNNSSSGELSNINTDTATTLNSSAETKEMVMGTSKYVFEKVSNNTVHLFITRSTSRRRKKPATQLTTPVNVSTVET